MRTKAAIIHEIQNAPEHLELLKQEAKNVELETTVKVDPIDLGLLQAVFADRLGFQEIRYVYYEQDYGDIIDKVKRLPYVQKILKKYPELDLALTTMIDPFDADHEFATGPELVLK